MTLRGDATIIFHFTSEELSSVTLKIIELDHQVVSESVRESNKNSKEALNLQ